MTTSQHLLRKTPRSQPPCSSQATIWRADHKHKVWQANATTAAKASYKAGNRAPKRSASADFQHYWTTQLSSVQHSVFQGDIHSAYNCLKQLSKPKRTAGRTLRDLHDGRTLQSGISELRSAYLKESAAPQSSCQVASPLLKSLLSSPLTTPIKIPFPQFQAG